MNYTRINFKEFKENFIDKAAGGFYPVHSRIKEDNDGVFHPLVKLDMICEWRLDEGKVKFLEVEFSNDEEYESIKKYVLTCIAYLSASILENLNDLDKYKSFIE